MIRSFLSFLYQEGYIDANIAKGIVLPFTEMTTPYFLTQAECIRLRNACSDNPRDGAIIELLLQTGITLSELICLTLDDIEIGKTMDTEQKFTGFIRILGGRGRKQRVIPLNHTACLALQKHLDIRKAAGSNILFLNRFNEPLRERGVQKILRKYLKKTGLERASVRSLRHTFGIHHAVKGTSAKTIQEVMGHKDPRSTSIYFFIAQKMIRRELEDHAF